MVISDASPLIALAKIRRLRLLEELYGQVAIGPVVKSEAVDQGREIGASGVEQLETVLRTGWLRVVELTARERRLSGTVLESTGLDLGEAESIALAQSRQAMLIADEKKARAVAEALGVKCVGTAGVTLQAFIQRRMTLPQLERALQDLSAVLWLSPAVVAEILRQARKVAR